MPLAPVPASGFRRACAQFATGVTIATTIDPEGAPHGLTINSFTSVSLEPPLVLICIGHNSTVLKHFRAATHYAVNILAEDQRDLSNRFALRMEQRFDGVRWEGGVSGVPLITGALATIECRVAQTLEAGDHVILLAEAVDVRINGGNPLLYFNSAYALASR
ncbi:MAG: flavin reductase family protein [Bryobacteraceae bacterium]|nr:flavin reductase family protein [Bryobacteraceae bacterium]